MIPHMSQLLVFIDMKQRKKNLNGRLKKKLILQKSALLFKSGSQIFSKCLQNCGVTASKLNLDCPLTSMALDIFWNWIQRVPTLRTFWDLEKNVLHEIRVSGTVGGPLVTQKSPTCRYISQKLIEWKPFWWISCNWGTPCMKFFRKSCEKTCPINVLNPMCVDEAWARFLWAPR